MKKLFYQRYLKEHPNEFPINQCQSVQNSKKIKNPLIEYDSKLAKHIKMELSGNDRNRLYNRKNLWGNMSYTDLIFRSIESSVNKKLTLCEIYQWFRIYVPYFTNIDDTAIRRMKVRQTHRILYLYEIIIK